MGRSKEFDENVVLQKAMELFWEQGYEKTSLSDLVEHMGIHRRSLYDTFGDKHTLFLKTIDCYNELIKNKIQAEVSHAETSKQAIQFIFDFMIEGYEDRQWGCLIVNSATEMALRDKEVEEKTEEAFMQMEHFLADLVRKGQQTGEFSCDYDAEVLAEILQNTLLGIRVLLRTTASKEKMHRIADFLVNLLNK
ncbi:TetR/AcrR family transcriptional regulator [Clostridium estertheticum]|uniref:TetR/AcrR family transcriptional regulator n=1 Tax=Clostridium estertheticum TaxID=238834 RepID=A0AA47EIQ1_9CLOT|nr:TetR/AcrR family transcriptional regulator [Clostridium estertheticum]MBU3154244.1 TetR/AcrR family transcriptional regulator [Clostridium estertheticum]MBU3197989.1 TetR/AcrR family transcriptional regulator [Clostridium estertheticum]WAG60139.1 TetR/AcrR family transcriptional regulator [Clostridium estertheticum]WAG65784.1 TetR/AcrR family transcriptional regulator [Clostridium estertheticum]